jgi:hypothetical protein
MLSSSINVEQRVRESAEQRTAKLFVRDGMCCRIALHSGEAGIGGTQKFKT